jgi:16S rRNA (uracil1498-N3)-methyltransferase
MNVFYAPDISADLVMLDEGESQHAVKVLRLTAGDPILVMDGKGSICTAEITNPHHKKCECKVLEKSIAPQRPFHLHLAIAPTKLNDRMEWFLEKATEIGVEEITPVICARSERRQTNHERFNKVLVAAMKQSMNPWLPVLNEQEDLGKFLAQNEPGFIAHCMNTPRTALKNANLDSTRITILIGPEGDFTEAEILTALQKKWTPVSLGDTRLRTETAGIVACHTVTLLKS